MEYVILGLLFLEPMTLYQINKSFEQGISLFYSASLGSIQSALRQLFGKQWVLFDEVRENGRSKKVYHIAADGRNAFMKWMVEPLPTNKMEVVMMSKVFFLGLVESEDTRRTILHHMLDCALQMKQQLMNMELRLKKEPIPKVYKDIATYRMHTLEYGIQAHQTAIVWLGKMLEDFETS